MAAHMGAAYLRYSFTKGTRQEVDFLVEVLGLEAGMEVLDVGCGPGRHSHELARRGIRAHGIDLAPTFVELARTNAVPGATFEVADATTLDFEARFDAVISLCQGGFGLGLDDGAVLASMRRALRPGGRFALSAFNAYFQVRWLESTDHFDACWGVNRETTVVLDGFAAELPTEMWTGCYTPRELRLLLERAGLVVEHIWSVQPGRYRRDEPSIDTPEFLVVGGLH
jgi:SAM-dependent methyltransferase